MDTKHKVILVVFAAFFAVVFLIAVLGGKSKVEKFDEENFTDDDEEEKPKSKQPKKKEGKDVETKEKVKEEASTQPADYIKEAMNYLNSMNLPFKLKKEVFTELFNEEGMNKLEKFGTIEEVKKFVSGVVDVTKSAAASLASTEKFNNSPLLSGLEDVKKQISSLTTSLASVTASIEHFEKEHELPGKHGHSMSLEIPPSAKPSSAIHTPPSKSSGTSSSIEGFENVRSNYALF